MSMPVNNIRSLVLAGLPLILGTGAIALAVWTGLQTRPLPAGSGVTLHQALNNLPPELSAVISEENTPKKTQEGEDPFFRPQQKKPTQRVEQSINLEEVHLTTIARGNNGRYCLINGRIFYEGEEGSGFTITHIAPDKVYFETTFETFSLVPGQKVALEAGMLVPMEKLETKDKLAEPPLSSPTTDTKI